MESMGEGRTKSFIPKTTAVRKSRHGKVKGILNLDHGVSEGNLRQIKKGSLERHTKELDLYPIGVGKQIIQGLVTWLAG